MVLQSTLVWVTQSRVESVELHWEQQTVRPQRILARFALLSNPAISVLQGCPRSIILMAAIMTIWVRAMRSVPDASTHVFVDDRVVSTRSATLEVPLQAAATRNAEVDAALGLTRHLDKQSGASSTKR